MILICNLVENATAYLLLMGRTSSYRIKVDCASVSMILYCSPFCIRQCHSVKLGGTHPEMGTRSVSFSFNNYS